MRTWIGLMVIGMILVSVAAQGATGVFTQQPLPLALKSELTERGLWKPDCPVPLERLSLLQVSYVGFDGLTHDDGEMIALDAAASPLLKLFKNLYAQKFPIEKIRRTDRYGGDDVASTKDNNTSVYNCRPITNGALPSSHAYGLALDLNPLQNPFVGKKGEANEVEIIPPLGFGFLNRANQRPGMSEPIVNLFATHGFPVWGGTWNDPIDWQHFQTSRTVAILLEHMIPSHAEKMFALQTRYAQFFKAVSYVDDAPVLLKLYDQYGERLLQTIERHGTAVNKLAPKEAIRAIGEKLNAHTKR